MNIYVSLCLLAVFSTNLDIKHRIKAAVRKVEDIIQQFEDIRIETEEETVITITKRWWDQMNNFKSLVNELDIFMRREVRAAKAKDKAKSKDIQSCYDTNFCAISQHSDTAYKAAEKCIESAENSIKENLRFIDNLIALGQTLITELNEVLINCYNSDNSIAETCILTELESINDSVKIFEENAKYVEINASSASDYVILKANDNLKNFYNFASFESKEAKSSNSRCIQNVLKNKKNIINYLGSTCRLRVASV
ncbi:hypothetical protein ACFW04_003421 [Cataglyphis niger]